MFVRKAALMITEKTAPLPAFDPECVQIIDAFWFPQGEKGRMAMGACVTWVDFQSMKQLLEEYKTYADAAMSILDRQLMERKEQVDV